jgi:AraC family transcriptional regulator
MRSPVDKMLWFIESHFLRDVTLDELAKICGLSRFQVSRLFSHEMGMTVTSYVRGRRLTEAARALADGACDILGVALEAGYGSHEAFSRAFREQFGLTPAELRARGTVEQIRLVKPVRNDRPIPVRLCGPRIESPGPLLIAGIGRRFDCDDFAGIPSLWQEFHAQAGAIRGRNSEVSYGVVSGVLAEGNTYLYLAGVEVGDFAELDSSFTGLRLPAQSWAVFAHEGHITTILSTIHAVFDHGLADAGLRQAGMPDLLERYTSRFDPQTGTGGFEIWVPIA